MAIENKYINANLVADKATTAAFNEGAKTVVMVATFEVAAADDNASVFRLFKSVNPDLIPVKCEILSDAIAGATDYELGFYEPTEAGVLGPAIDIDALLGSTDINAGNARGSELNGLTAVAIEDVQKRIYELAGDTLTTKKLGYDIALTANVVGTAAGTISVTMWFVQG